MDVKGHILFFTVHHVQQVRPNWPFCRISAEVQHHNTKHCEDDTDGLLVWDIANSQTWGKTGEESEHMSLKAKTANGKTNLLKRKVAYGNTYGKHSIAE